MITNDWLNHGVVRSMVGRRADPRVGGSIPLLAMFSQTLIKRRMS